MEQTVLGLKIKWCSGAASHVAARAIPPAAATGWATASATATRWFQSPSRGRGPWPHECSSPRARTTGDPNYSGCLDPNASDYDCSGGSGDGPRYTGEVRVVGDDRYDLDRDGDGIACEPS